MSGVGIGAISLEELASRPELAVVLQLLLNVSQLESRKRPK
jgi:hypothetical protein